MWVISRDAIFRKMTNQNQIDTNEMATTETKYQTNFYSAEKNTNIYPNFNKSVHKKPTKYQENTKKFGTEIPNTDLVLVFSWFAKFFCFRLTSLVISVLEELTTTPLPHKGNTIFYQ